MYRTLCVAVVVLSAGFSGCASGRRGASDPHGVPATAGAVPTTRQVECVAPALAEALDHWRITQRSNERVLVRGPTFVGLQGASAREASELGGLLGEAINQHADPRLRFVRPAYNGDDAAAADGIFDARATWDPKARRGSDPSPRVGLEIVDPRSGRTVFSNDAAVPPSAPGAAVADAKPAADASAPARQAVGLGLVAEPGTGGGGSPVPAPPATDAMTQAPATAERAALPEPTAGSLSPATPRQRDATRVTRQTRSKAPPATRERSRSVVASLPHGVIYFDNAGLADRVIILQERTARADNGALSVRLVLTSRKGKRTLEIRCDFYDEQGAAVGGVRSVKLPVREGAPATIALASYRPATRYVMFVKD
ncbi:MAG TPA: hypothetical protein PLC79_04340 [Phycisphaerae bacterium]|mgnify:CR=1 FL=1|nr:hypothetical protein [Phycisphaerae bacterium]